MTEVWTEARVKTLSSMWRDGISAELISRALGGVSRSAVLGKVHRLKLDNRRTNVVMRPYPTRARGKPFSAANQPKRASPPAPPTPPTSRWEPIPGAIPIDLMRLDAKTCRWPLGERPYLYCGCEAVSGSSYCQAHKAISMNAREALRA